MHRYILLPIFILCLQNKLLAGPAEAWLKTIVFDELAGLVADGMVNGLSQSSMRKILESRQHVLNKVLVSEKVNVKEGFKLKGLASLKSLPLLVGVSLNKNLEVEALGFHCGHVVRGGTEPQKPLIKSGTLQDLSTKCTAAFEVIKDRDDDGFYEKLESFWNISFEDRFAQGLLAHRYLRAKNYPEALRRLFTLTDDDFYKSVYLAVQGVYLLNEKGSGEVSLKGM